MGMDLVGRVFVVVWTAVPSEVCPVGPWSSERLWKLGPHGREYACFSTLV